MLKTCVQRVDAPGNFKSFSENGAKSAACGGSVANAPSVKRNTTIGLYPSYAPSWIKRKRKPPKVAFFREKKMMEKRPANQWDIVWDICPYLHAMSDVGWDHKNNCYSEPHTNAARCKRIINGQRCLRNGNCLFAKAREGTAL